MNKLSRQEYIQIETLKNCCRTFIWIGRMDRANMCLILAKKIYYKSIFSKSNQTETLEFSA